MHPCPFCPQIFSSLRGLSIHRTRTHHAPVEFNCIDCNIELTADNQLRTDRKLGIRLCAQCKRDRATKWMTDNLEKNRIRENGNYAKRSPQQISLDNEHNRQRTRKARSILRFETIQAYGGCCECCGETIHEFLCIDHYFHNGASDKRVSAGGLVFYSHLKKLGWPKGEYRLLCYNCNLSRGRYGYCPHQTQLELFPSAKNKRQFFND